MEFFGPEAVSFIERSIVIILFLSISEISVPLACMSIDVSCIIRRRKCVIVLCIYNECLKKLTTFTFA